MEWILYFNWFNIIRGKMLIHTDTAIYSRYAKIYVLGKYKTTLIVIRNAISDH